MGRKVTNMQRIINFGLGASNEALDSAIEALQVIKANRYPKVVKTVRAKRSDAGKSRIRTQTSTTDADNAGGKLSSES